VPHVLVEGPWEGDTLPVAETTRHHLERVLRLAPGAAVTYTDGAGRIGEGLLDPAGISRGRERTEPERESGSVTVAVSPPRDSNRARFVVEKLGELGVDRLWWLRAERTEGRPPRDEKAHAWAVAALQQSRGSRLLQVSGTVTPAEVAARGPALVAVPGAAPLAGLDVAGPAVVCIGPEGGFAPEELPAAMHRVGLGSRVLRVETAAVVAATLLVFRRR
jgi:16S rRNA (uracil1498-N3)-methyltransferase